MNIHNTPSTRATLPIPRTPTIRAPGHMSARRSGTCVQATTTRSKIHEETKA